MIDWDRFYQWLESRSVELPAYEPGDPVSLSEVASVMVKVQNSRSDLDAAARKLDQKIGLEKRNIHVWQERRRMVRLDAKRSDEVRRLSRREDRDAAVETASQGEDARIAVAKARVEELEAARKSIQAMVATLETAKQTLNALKQVGLADPSAQTL